MSTRDRVAEEYLKNGGNIAAVARTLGIARSTAFYHIKKMGLQPMAEGRIKELQTDVRKRPRGDNIRRYILTSAQNNTRVHEGFLKNLLRMRELYDAELIVGTFTYNQNSYGKLSVKRGTNKERESELWYDASLEPYIHDGRVELAPGLHWCGEMNILPTAVRPLTGLETYTGQNSGIFPHAKLAMSSVPSGKHDQTKFNYTTGTVTQRNYIQKKEGIKAEFHHVYGALLVEVNSKGQWWVRQVVADEDGDFFDLEHQFMSGEVFEHKGVEAVTWGDIHAAVIDQRVKDACWAPGGMIDALKPRVQIFHDLFDGLTVNHHERGKCHERFRRHVEGWNSVHDELLHVIEFLEFADRPFSESVVVDSNHDHRLKRWLQESDYRSDPTNAELFLDLQLEVYRSIRRGSEVHVLEHALKVRGCPEEIVFLKEDESYAVSDGKIECGIHGHLGPNGSRGTPSSLSKLGTQANTAHTHSAAILDGLYVAGASAKLEQGYNKGPSSWSHTHIVVYPNGKRTLITVNDGKWRA